MIPGLAAGGDLSESEDGSLLEPYEEVHIETSNETVGVWWKCWAPGAAMMDMQDAGQGMTRITYIAPTRGPPGVSLSIPHINEGRRRDAHGLSRL